MQSYILVLILGYIIGCFQSSYILSKLIKKVDIRDLGNGNAGASNTVIALGWKYGVLVALLDIGKAVASLMIVKFLYQGDLSFIQLSFLLYLNGLAVILGHNFPFYMGFRGGKGTASLVGMLLVIDWRISLLGILAIILITILSDFIALGTIGLNISFILSTIYFRYSLSCLIIVLILAVMSTYKHLPNIKRIINGTETGLRKVVNR